MSVRSKWHDYFKVTQLGNVKELLESAKRIRVLDELLFAVSFASS